jgi:hypothetical protein
MGRLLDDTYKSKKDEIKQELSDALTKIHLGSTCGHRLIGMLLWQSQLIFLTARASTSRAYWHSVASSGVIAEKVLR